MSEIARITDLLDRTFEGDAWHGPPVSKALEGVTAARAAAKPVAGAHSIWEITLHMRAWKDIVRRRLEGEVFAVEQDGPEDWPRVGATGDSDWKAAVDGLRAAHRALRQAIAAFDRTKLDDPVGGRSDSAYVLIHGIVHHDLYHAGQISLLRKQ